MSVTRSVVRSIVRDAVRNTAGTITRRFFTADGTDTTAAFDEVTLTADCSIPFQFINSGAAGIRTIIGHSVGVLSQVYCEGTSVKARLAGSAPHDFGAVPTDKLLSGFLVRVGTGWTLQIDGVAQGGTYTAAGNVVLDRLISNAGVALWDDVVANVGIVSATDDINILWPLNSGGTVSEPSKRAGGEVLTFSSFASTDWELFSESGNDWINAQWPNLVKWSEDFSNVLWNKRGITLTSSTDTAPDGSATAATFQENGAHANPALFMDEDTSPDASAQTFQVWMKASSATSFNLSTQGLTGGGSVNLTTEWQLFDVTQSVNDVVGPHMGGFSSITRFSGIIFSVWHPQLSAGSVVRDYSMTTDITGRILESA